MTHKFSMIAFAAFLFGATLSLPQSAHAQESWDVCPAPAQALSDVPGQLDQLQADIDRFTLCLNRAELLMKLDDLKSQNAGGGSNLAMNLPGAMAPSPLTPEQTAQLMGDASAVSATPSAAAMTPPSSGYAVRDIRGIGGSLVARLQSPEGAFEDVRIGDRLDDGSEVTAITVTQVTVSEKGKARRLEWQ